MKKRTKEQGEPEENDEFEEAEKSEYGLTDGMSTKQADQSAKEQAEPKEEQSGAKQTRGTSNGTEKHIASKSYVRMAANAIPSFL